MLRRNSTRMCQQCLQQLHPCRLRPADGGAILRPTEGPMESPQAKPQHISDHLANERTILAWIRTSISVIALGVAINRFSLFLMEFYRIEPQARASNRHAEAVGPGLVILALAIMCRATWHYLALAHSRD